MSATIDQPNQPVPGIGAEGMARMDRATKAVAAFFAFIAGAALVWWGAVTVFRVPAFIMPTPGAAFEAFILNRAEIGQAVLATLGNAALGLAVAFAIAVTLAAIFVSSRTVTRAMLPLVIALRTAPVLVIAPILIMIFGRGTGTAVVVVVIVSFFPIMVNAMKGFGATRRNTLELMHVLGASWSQTFFKVRFPQALSYIFTGLRAAATSAILAAMLAEWLSGAPGLGTLILDASSYKKAGLMWAAVVVSMLMAFTIFSLTTLVERRLLSWRS